MLLNTSLVFNGNFLISCDSPLEGVLIAFSLEVVVCFILVPGGIEWVRVIMRHWSEMVIFGSGQIVLAYSVH